MLFSNFINSLFIVIIYCLTHCLTIELADKSTRHDFHSEMWTVQFSDRQECALLPEPPTGWSQAGLLNNLTDPCRYNKQIRPPSDGPNKIHARVYVYFLKAYTSLTLQFQSQILLQLKWNDSRLNFEQYNASFDAILGEKYLMNSIWMPHVYLTNEKDSLVMGFLRKDDFVVVHDNGVVTFTTRLKTKVTCQMKLGKFPFDVQKCSLKMDSWRYDSDELILEWEKVHPVIIKGGVNLTEFKLISWEPSSELNELYSSQHMHDDDYTNDQSNYSTAHNFSTLVLTFTLAREYGFYIMDYYIPSVLLVILSWVSFWLTPDALPARINLGSSTMLTFLLLGWTADGMPKLSQFQYNNIWEVGCTLFIFLTLVEFAFVNTIHRSGYHKVPLKKPTSKYILKSSLVTPPKPPKVRVRRTSSCPSSPEIKRHFQNFDKKPKHKVIEELSSSDFVCQLNSRLEEEKIKMEKIDENKPLRSKKVSVGIIEPFKRDKGQSHRSIGNGIETEGPIRCDKPLDPLPNQSPAPRRRKFSILPPRKFSVMPQFTMTNHEIAKWIDEKSRIVFPTAFFLFCLVYWSFLLI